MRKIILLLILSLLVTGTIYNKAREINPKTDLIYQVPTRLTLEKDTILWMMNLRVAFGGVAYQSGYQDCVDDINSRLGIRKSQFSSRPHNVFLDPYLSSNISTVRYRYQYEGVGGYYTLNNTNYDIMYKVNNTWVRNPNVFFRYNGTLMNATINISEVRVYARR